MLLGHANVVSQTPKGRPASVWERGRNLIFLNSMRSPFPSDIVCTRTLFFMIAMICSTAGIASAQSSRAESSREFMRLLELAKDSPSNFSWSSEAQTSELEKRIDDWRSNLLPLGGSAYAVFRNVDAESAADTDVRYARQDHRRYVALVDREVASVDEALEELLREKKNSHPDVAYLKLKARRVWWEIAKTLAPRSAAQAAQKVFSLVDKAGSLADFRAATSQRREAEVDSVRMPKAAAKDAQFSKLSERAFKNTGWNEKLLRIVITDKAWTPVRHAVSGKVIGRRRGVALAAKQGSGTCMLYTMTISQDRNGSGFTDPQRYSHDAKPIACKNVNK